MVEIPIQTTAEPCCRMVEAALRLSGVSVAAGFFVFVSRGVGGGLWRTLLLSCLRLADPRVLSLYRTRSHRRGHYRDPGYLSLRC